MLTLQKSRTSDTQFGIYVVTAIVLSAMLPFVVVSQFESPEKYYTAGHAAIAAALGIFVSGPGGAVLSEIINDCLGDYFGWMVSCMASGTAFVSVSPSQRVAPIYHFFFVVVFYLAAVVGLPAFIQENTVFRLVAYFAGFIIILDGAFTVLRPSLQLLVAEVVERLQLFSEVSSDLFHGIFTARRVLRCVALGAAPISRDCASMLVDGLACITKTSNDVSRNFRSPVKRWLERSNVVGKTGPCVSIDAKELDASLDSLLRAVRRVVSACDKREFSLVEKMVLVPLLHTTVVHLGALKLAVVN